MPQINVTIAGRSYRMACEEGQEAHVEGLAAGLDSRIEGLKGTFGEIGDQRLIVIASLIVCDELQELKSKIAKLEAKVAAPAAPTLNPEHLAHTVNAIAQRLESLADGLAAQA